MEDSKFIRVSMTPMAREILKIASQKFTEVSGRKVSLSETVERLFKKSFVGE